MIAEPPQGDNIRLDERLVVAGGAGVFRPSPPETVTTEGEIVRPGQVLGTIEGPGSASDVISFCTGFLMRMLVEPGERVRAGQPLVWVHDVGAQT